MIPLFKPTCSDEEIKAVAGVLKSGWWGLGPKTKEFEEKFAEYVGSRYAVCLNSATSALHLSLKALDLPEGSEVITSPITFISTAFAIEYNNLKPVFADIERDTLNLDPNDVKRKVTSKTRAILPVHFGGHICDMDSLASIASKNNLFIVEDAAHAAGSSYNGKKAGTFGRFGCFSFHAVKNLAMGDGGIITTSDKKDYERLLRLRWMGIDKSTSARTSRSNYVWDYNVSELGFKCHGNDILSSIGLVQLKKLEGTNKRRRQIFEKYNKELKNLVETPVLRKGHTSACHNYVAKVKDRDRLIGHLSENSISSGVHYKPLYLHSYYGKLKTKCPVADEVWGKIISLPVFPDLGDEEIEKVVACIKDFYGK